MTNIKQSFKLRFIFSSKKKKQYLIDIEQQTDSTNLNVINEYFGISSNSNFYN